MGKGQASQKVERERRGGSTEPSRLRRALAGLVLNDAITHRPLLDGYRGRAIPNGRRVRKLSRSFMEKELERLQVELK